MKKNLMVRVFAIIVSFAFISVFFQNCGQPGSIVLEGNNQKPSDADRTPNGSDPDSDRLANPVVPDPVTLISNPSLVINNGQLYTKSKNVTLSSATIGAQEMIISNTPDCTSNVGWEQFSAERAWILNRENSNVSVYAKFRKKGAPETDCISASIIHDNIPPIVEITKAAPPYTTLTSVKVEFQVLDLNGSGAAVSFCKDADGIEQMCDQLVEFNSLAKEGNYSVVIHAKDNAGNESLPVTESFIVDRTAPAITINGPTGLTADRNPKYNIDIVESGGLKSVGCRLSPVETAYQSCVSREVNYTNLASGEYKFEVLAIDMAGNTSGASKSLEIDASVPSVKITKNPAAIGNIKDVSFEFSGISGTRAISKFTCTLDGKNPVTCSSPLSYPKLADKEYLFSVIGTNEVGAHSVAQSYKFVVDTLAPVITVTGAPSARTKSRAATFVINAEDLNGIAEIQCSLNGATINCSNKTAKYENLPDGKYVFFAKAFDNARNSVLSTGIEWIIDNTPDSKILASLEKNPIKQSDVGKLDITLTQVREASYKCINLSNKTTVTSGNLIQDVSSVNFTVSEDMSCVVAGKDKLDKIIQETVTVNVNCGNKLKENGQCLDFKCNTVIKIAADPTSGILNIPARKQSEGVCYAMKLFDAIPNGPSNITKLVDKSVLSRDHENSILNRDPYNMGSTKLNFVLAGPRVVKLSGGMDATTPIRIDNFALIGLYPKAINPTSEHYAAYGTSDSAVNSSTIKDSILFNENPIKIKPFGSFGTATVTPLEIVNEADTNLNYMLDIRALDCAGMRELSDIYLLFQ
ncbi:MAG: hypothetical protein JNL11_05060 [Bdellovibrionaceae bacterium]|nr:hypothetical protein [Pseudobdellovibrionaceae bacterium]